ncbi:MULTISPECIES: tRNA (adenosine(37)-N6)-threonylcarbamoyltransferase complex transferase subunit TsaD [unclassified Spirosoma]|uniref:tRNA (adenosine(37)-N6)-threonylcarbamoyltransferase complex transferase subunit TsaD n=1 Tax=unclassified Spirosoma TaxID=2621999 RepID=UPI00096A1F86|nr:MULTISPECIES: tRNA (adenosine(37)-N6)-threonylcarbamoyltransferase complex transferase subunit TsaD [unclassified Spirosoma]MBN8820538.1 tRNA (adenosine(37)-N6)-threonylcarbamoyltransferase complex transferase subunit TsaD [Spirosoma sp.]OJW71327.1 MAG: tRNA (adenosine(37)-N6)-threonylcarbamoyltransferase complex transferase subunit TsaD [Spirosoma sp. 48-14]
MNILAIESSCDETSASVLVNGHIRSNVIATQLIHEQYGGVVPELASRAHQQHILPVVERALADANLSKKALSAVAFTRGPGLLGSLLVGASFAKALALGLNIPLIEVNHMQAHVLAHFIENPKPAFPFLCLTVSGGHTQIVRVDGPLNMTVIGQTMDDAVGEAFDKSAKLLGLPYPGGPLVDKYAKAGNPLAFRFPMSEMPNLDFSFSGIKTAILYFLRDRTKANPGFIEENMADICASIQHTLVQMLLTKLKRAARETGIREIAIAGGVSANSGLRTALTQLGESLGWKVYIPRFEYCTDNAAMIAIAAQFKYEQGDFTAQTVSPMPRMEL